jgi:hypothetical protein
MRLRLFAALALTVGATLNIVSPAKALEFYPISSIVSDNSVAYFPITNLIEGPGIGFDVNEPHDRTSGATWVTDAPGGFPSDYIAVAGAPILVLDLGVDVELSAISTWGYADNANGVSEFKLRFATSAEGPAGFGTSIDYNPTFNTGLPFVPMNLNVFGEGVTARYVEFTASDNYFVAPGTGEGGEVPGGDRVGLGEIAFPVAVPEPSSIVLVSIAACGALLAVRRRASK